MERKEIEYFEERNKYYIVDFEKKSQGNYKVHTFCKS